MTIATRTFWVIAIVSLGFAIGCEPQSGTDVDIDTTPNSTSVEPANDSPDVNIDVDSNEPRDDGEGPLENLGEAIENVDVDTDEDGVNVDIN